MDNDFEEVANCVNDDVPFATVHFFTRIVAAFAASFSGFRTLAVDNGGGRFGCSSLSLAVDATQPGNGLRKNHEQ